MCFGSQHVDDSMNYTDGSSGRWVGGWGQAGVVRSTGAKKQSR